MLHFNGKIVVWQNVSSSLKDGSQFPCQKTMLYVIMHPCLKETGFLNAPSAPAIDEAPSHMTHLGNVIMSGNKRTVRKPEGDRFFRVRAQMSEKFVNVHKLTTIIGQANFQRRRTRRRTNLVHAA
jgi:hypothetical protein